MLSALLSLLSSSPLQRSLSPKTTPNPITVKVKKRNRKKGRINLSGISILSVNFEFIGLGCFKNYFNGLLLETAHLILPKSLLLHAPVSPVTPQKGEFSTWSLMHWLLHILKFREMVTDYGDFQSLTQPPCLPKKAKQRNELRQQRKEGKQMRQQKTINKNIQIQKRKTSLLSLIFFFFPVRTRPRVQWPLPRG